MPNLPIDRERAEQLTKLVNGTIADAIERLVQEMGADTVHIYALDPESAELHEALGRAAEVSAKVTAVRAEGHLPMTPVLATATIARNHIRHLLVQVRARSPQARSPADR